MATFEFEQQEEIYTVSRLNNEARFLLEDTFALVWIEGEISNFAAPQSGHWYFSLKDASAQVRCAMFRMSQRKLNFTPKDGSHVLLRARVSLYENRGDFQLIAEDMEERGEGKLRRAYEALKKKLEAAGLFAAEHKKVLPPFPKQIGVITSATGAAIRDILTVLKRRAPYIEIIIYPTLVQGAQAAETIANAIQIANRRQECDVLIVARGGGTLEDLWPFNEEIVAQAIFASNIPIISGVGHEVDFTISDFVADLRAPTPSAAAEIATPDCAELLKILLRAKQQVLAQINQKLAHIKTHISWIQKNLAQQHPKRRLTEKMQHLDLLEISLAQLSSRLLNQLLSKLKNLDLRLHRQIPLQQISALQHRLSLDQQHLINAMSALINKQRSKLANTAGKLDGISPLATLNRGYAIASTPDHSLLHDATQVKPGNVIEVRLAKGSLECEVKKIN